MPARPATRCAAPRRTGAPARTARPCVRPSASMPGRSVRSCPPRMRLIPASRAYSRVYMLPSPVMYVSHPSAIASSSHIVSARPRRVTMPTCRAVDALRWASGTRPSADATVATSASHPPSTVPCTPASDPSYGANRPSTVIPSIAASSWPVRGRARSRARRAPRTARPRRPGARRACARAGRGRCTTTRGGGRAGAGPRPRRRARSSGRWCSRSSATTVTGPPASTTSPFSGSSARYRAASSSSSSQPAMSTAVGTLSRRARGRRDTGR